VGVSILLILKTEHRGWRSKAEQSSCARGSDARGRIIEDDRVLRGNTELRYRQQVTGWMGLNVWLDVFARNSDVRPRKAHYT
jgi:hypothetical protein